MRATVRSIVVAGVGVALAIATVGCTIGSATWVSPQSHFDYPNSNVIPIGRVQGEASGPVSLFPSPMDADVMEEAIQNALKQKGGDILLNYSGTFTVTLYPILFNFYKTTYTVEGTAAKMEIGKQMLK